MGRTKDERFIIQLHEATANALDDDSMFNCYEIGQAIGLSTKTVNTIVTLLARANFIYKDGDADISLSKNGLELVLRLTQ